MCAPRQTPVGLKNLDHVVGSSLADDQAARRYSCIRPPSTSARSISVSPGPDFRAFEPSQWWSLVQGADD
jgi:hypothetical protein